MGGIIIGFCVCLTKSTKTGMPIISDNANIMFEFRLYKQNILDIVQYILLNTYIQFRDGRSCIYT